MILGPHHPAGPHRVVFNIPDHSKQVPVVLNRKGMKPFLEEVPAYALLEIDAPSVAPVRLSDGPRQRLGM